jgi:hypothetical protein
MHYAMGVRQDTFVRNVTDAMAACGIACVDPSIGWRTAGQCEDLVSARSRSQCQLSPDAVQHGRGALGTPRLRGLRQCPLDLGFVALPTVGACATQLHYFE